MKLQILVFFIPPDFFPFFSDRVEHCRVIDFCILDFEQQVFETLQMGQNLKISKVFSNLFHLQKMTVFTALSKNFPCHFVNENSL